MFNSFRVEKWKLDVILLKYNILKRIKLIDVNNERVDAL